MIGKYRVLEQIGEGGMATVYKAYDTQLEREVAIKMIRSSAFPMEGLQNVLKRFEREAKALARLSHTNIISVIDYGEHEGSPYLVMTYLPGGTMKQIMGHPMPWQDSARLLLPVARALDYAHRQGVLHRDVKPANILMTQSGDPMLSDFGLAKIMELGEGHTLTASGISLGTPEYMAPEQGMGRDVDGRVDVYSLGVVLYELITGRKPFTADTPMAVIFKHISEPLPSPRLFVPDLPFEVENILFRAMEKEPENRYPDMHAFAEALEQMASGNLVLQEGFGLPVGLERSSAATLEPVDSLAPTRRDEAKPAQTRKARRRKEEAQTLPPDAEPETLQPRTMSLLSPRQKSGRVILGVGTVLLFLVAALLILKSFAPGEQKNSITPVFQQSTSIGLGQVGQLNELVTLGYGSIAQMALSPAGNVLAVATARGVHLYQPESLTHTGFLDTGGTTTSIAFSPDGKYLISGTLSRKVQIWKMSDLTLLRTLEQHEAGVKRVAFSLDGEHFASGDNDGTICIWRMSDMQVESTLQYGNGGVLSLAFSQDGQKLAAGFEDGPIKLWSVKGGAPLHALKGHEMGTKDLLFSPDGARLVSVGEEGLAKVWRVEDGTLEREIKAETNITCVAFSPDGQNLLFGKWFEADIEMIRLSDGEAAGKIAGQRGGTFGMAVLPDGENLIVWAQDETIRRISSVDGKIEEQVLDFGEAPESLAFSPDGAWLVSAGRDGLIHWWGARDGSLNAQWQGNSVVKLIFTADGKLVSLGQDGMLRVWRPGDATPERMIEGLDGGLISSVALSPDGRYFATGQYDNQLYIRNFTDETLVQTLQGHSKTILALAFSPDGQWLASGGQDQSLHVWRVSDWQEVYVFKDMSTGLSGVFFSPDSQHLFANTWDGSGAAWRMSDGSQEYTFSDLGGMDQGLAISPTGEWLASAAYTRLRIWKVDGGGLVSEIPIEGNFLQTVVFSPDGAYLAVGEMDGTIHLLGVPSP